MIQANELRIGNWITVSGNTLDTYQTSKPIQVTADIIKAIQEENNERPDAMASHFERIPLSPDTLEKCGFEKESEGGKYWHNDETYLKHLPPYGYRLVYGVSKIGVYITTLHQLQNLYHALTGNELTYKP